MTTKEQQSTKQIIRQATESLPEDVDLDDALEHIILVHTLIRRIERAGEEPTYTQEEVEQMMAEWQD
jgi:hypothetical protein